MGAPATLQLGRLFQPLAAREDVQYPSKIKLGWCLTLIRGAFERKRKFQATGYFIRDRHALVTLRMGRVTSLKLEGDAGSIISELVIRRMHASASPADWQTCAGPQVGDFEVAFDSAVGLFGRIYAKDLNFDLHPTGTGATS